MDHSGLWLKRPHVHTAHQLGVRTQYSDLFATASGDDADRSGQLVFNRQPAVEEGYDHFLDTRGEGDTQEDVRGHLFGFIGRKDPSRLDPESLLRNTGLFRVKLRRHEVQADLAAAPAPRIP